MNRAAIAAALGGDICIVEPSAAARHRAERVYEAALRDLHNRGAPNVVDVVRRVLSKNADATPDDILAALEESAEYQAELQKHLWLLRECSYQVGTGDPYFDGPISPDSRFGQIVHESLLGHLRERI